MVFNGMSEKTRNHGSDTKVETRQNNVGTESTRRRTLKLAGRTSVGALAFSGLVAADNDSDNSPDANKTSKNSSIIDEDAEKVAEGTSTFITENDQSPDWYTIGPHDELKHKPEGLFINEKEGLCFGGVILKISGYEFTAKACHYGGCEWEVKGCVAACASTGAQDDCDHVATLSIGGSTSPISGELTTYPETVSPSTVILTQRVEGEVCHYDPVDGQSCYNYEADFNFDDGTIDR